MLELLIVAAVGLRLMNHLLLLQVELLEHQEGGALVRLDGVPDQLADHDRPREPRHLHSLAQVGGELRDAGAGDDAAEQAEVAMHCGEGAVMQVEEQQRPGEPRHVDHVGWAGGRSWHGVQRPDDAQNVEQCDGGEDARREEACKRLALHLMGIETQCHRHAQGCKVDCTRTRRIHCAMDHLEHHQGNHADDERRHSRTKCPRRVVGLACGIVKLECPRRHMDRGARRGRPGLVLASGTLAGLGRRPHRVDCGDVGRSHAELDRIAKQVARDIAGNHSGPILRPVAGEIPEAVGC